MKRAKTEFLAIALLGLLSACGGGGSGGAKATADLSNPALRTLVEQAKNEKQIVFVNSFDGGTALLRQLEQGFNARYGLDLKLVGRQSSNLPGEMSKAVEEFRSGRPSSIDVIMGSEGHVGGLLRVNGVQPFDWSWSTTIGKAARAYGGGGIVPVITRIPGITYSTERVKGADVPQTMAAFVASKGTVATTSYPSALTIYAQPEFWGEDRARAFVRQLSGKAKGVIQCGQTARILSGEFDLFGPNCGVEEVVAETQKGAPLGFVIPRDAPILAYLYLAVPRNAPHKAAAQLFIDYMLTPEAQAILYKSEASDLHKLAGSRSAKIVTDAQKQGIKFVEVDVDFAQRHGQSMGKLRGEFQQLLQKQ